MRVITWNLFHGRDAPPDPELVTWRSRLLRTTERNATHAQVNRSLIDEFATVIARDPWQVALLQEAPPRWLGALCARAGAHGASALTARNVGAFGRAWLAERNPDLMVSAAGGSNQVLARPPWRIAEVRRLTLTRRPQRRRMLWTRLERGDGGSICAVCLHATNGDEPAATREVELAAERAVAWSGGTPLLLGGDFNLRPRSAPEVFRRLAEQHALTPPAADGSVDHVLVRGLDLVGAPETLPATWRELPERDGATLRLSDHAAVAIEASDAHASCNRSR